LLPWNRQDGNRFRKNISIPREEDLFTARQRNARQEHEVAEGDRQCRSPAESGEERRAPNDAVKEHESAGAYQQDRTEE
jgi:hypothetical protein